MKALLRSLRLLIFLQKAELGRRLVGHLLGEPSRTKIKPGELGAEIDAGKVRQFQHIWGAVDKRKCSNV